MSRAANHAPDIPVNYFLTGSLVLTVSPDPAVHGEALEAGADEVLPKSAELDEIVAVIRRLASD